MTNPIARAALGAIIGTETQDDARPCACGCAAIGSATSYALPFKARECDECHFRGPEASTLEDATRLWNVLLAALDTPSEVSRP